MDKYTEIYKYYIEEFEQLGDFETIDIEKLNVLYKRFESFFRMEGFVSKGIRNNPKIPTESKDVMFYFAERIAKKGKAVIGGASQYKLI